MEKRGALAATGAARGARRARFRQAYSAARRGPASVPVPAALCPCAQAGCDCATRPDSQDRQAQVASVVVRGRALSVCQALTAKPASAPHDS